MNFAGSILKEKISLSKYEGCPEEKNDIFCSKENLIKFLNDPNNIVLLQKKLQFSTFTE